jgi:hypothetical protein
LILVASFDRATLLDPLVDSDGARGGFYIT